MNPRKLKSLIKVMQAGGVSTLKLEGVEITLDPRFMELPEPAAPVESEADPTSQAPQYTDEDILLWSAVGMEGMN